MRLAADRFYVVTGSRLRRARRQAGSRSICRRRLRDDPRGHLRLCGDQHRRPASARHPAGDDRRRSVQRRVPLSHGARDRDRPARRARAARVGYVGELGWELHVPTEYAAHVYERLMEAGAEHGIVDAGYRAIESLPAGEGLRLLVGRHHAGHQSLRGRARLRGGARQGRFHRPRGACADQGRRAARGSSRRSRSRALRRSSAARRSSPTAKVVGTTTSAGFGYTVGKTIALGYLPAELGERGAIRDRGLRQALPGDARPAQSLRSERREAEEHDRA